MVESVDAEVVAATFDAPEADQARVAEMALARAKRLVEGGRDVVILMDSLTGVMLSLSAFLLFLTPGCFTLNSPFSFSLFANGAFTAR